MQALPTPQASDLLTVEDVARRLNIKPGTVRKWVARGDLTGFKISPKALRFYPATIDEFIAAREERAAS